MDGFVGRLGAGKRKQSMNFFETNMMITEIEISGQRSTSTLLHFEVRSFDKNKASWRLKNSS